ncbi:MAG: HEPN domain-containing protein [Candidatus Margulisbacteria bacterium]|jgi:HEPN domain-containing protein|nr:HEPN domain-containing protein [Candidatus Margulisiibacteriota bacterium]
MTEIELAKQWLRYAYNDLLVAKNCLENMHPQQTEIACYHCQQSAEKALKGFLVYCQTEPPKIHDLRVLCQLCSKKDERFSTIYNMCSELTPLGVPVKYPNELSADETIASTSVDSAQKIYDFCFAKIPEQAN